MAESGSSTLDETEVGSYFVANYPPFSVWTREAVAADARPALASPHAAGVPLGLYLHIPFCRKRCHFCYFRVYTDKNAADVQRYLDTLVREWELYQEQSAVAGRPLDEPQFEPIFACMAELDAPIWLHPVGTASLPDYPAEKKSRFEMWWCFHWPYETSVAMLRMVFDGLFDRHPNLRIITHHLGGMIPYYDGRVGNGLKVLGARTTDEDYSKILPSLKRPHMDYLHDFFADTAMFGGGAHAIRCGLEFFGADKVVFATDAPLGPIGVTVETIKKLELAPEDQRKLFSGNAEKLLKMNF